VNGPTKDSRGLGLLRFERRHEPLLPFRSFLYRLARTGLIAMLFILGSLGIGVLGYHWIGRLGWLDATLNAAMILTGMGPVDHLRSSAAKLFATGYALFSGVAFLTIVGLFMAPIAHRVLHRFHVAEENSDGGA
jgi:hypothetical protein